MFVPGEENLLFQVQHIYVLFCFCEGQMVNIRGFMVHGVSAIGSTETDEHGCVPVKHLMDTEI